MPAKFVEKEERKQKGGYENRTEHKTSSVRNTGRQTGREESIHTRLRLIETDKQTRNVREGDRGYYWQSAKVGDSHSGHVDLTSCMECFQSCDHDSERNVYWQSDGKFLLWEHFMRK